MESIVRRLKELNPRCEIVGCQENVSEENAARLISGADIVVDAAPLFQERLALNRAAFAQDKPLVECAMHGMEANVSTFLPRRSGCLECYVHEVPASWKREFPVFGAVSGTAGCIGAAEVIKLVTGIGEPLAGELLAMDLAAMKFRRVKLPRRSDCPVCGGK
jgi:molybdopterin/thiamine biosynthesis adenylyltransferase